MSATDIVFGTRISLDDHSSPVVADADIGLYNVTSDLANNASQGQKLVTVDDGTKFEEGDLVTVSDDLNSESNVIDSIAGNTLTMYTNLVITYLTSENAKVDGNSVFRWIQNDISGVTGWKSGMEVQGGVGKWNKKIELGRGGNVASPGNSSIIIKNTDKFWYTIGQLSIFFQGKKFERFEFENSTPVRRWSGICNKPVWDAKKYHISAKGYHNKRIAQILTQTNITDYPDASGDTIGKTIPGTWGEVKPKTDASDNIIYNGYVKFIRTADKQIPLKTEGTVPFGDHFFESSTEGITEFPIVGTDGADPSKAFNVQLGKEVSWFNSSMTPITSGTFAVTGLVDQYIDVVDGLGLDEIRSISSVIVDASDNFGIMECTVADYNTEQPNGNSDATLEDNSWISVTKHSRGYKPDVWPCFGYIDSDGESLEDKSPEIYSYTEQKKAVVTSENTDASVLEQPESFIRLPEYAYTDESSDNNELDIDVKLFNGNPDQMDSFLMKPIVDIEPINTLTLWQVDAASYERHTHSGFYVLSSSGGASSVTITETNSPTNAYDRDYSTYYEYKAEAGLYNTRTYIAHDLTLPEIPKNFSFDSVYLGMRLKCKSDSTGTPPTDYKPRLRVFWRRFMGTPIEAFMFDAAPSGLDFNTVVDIDCLPDFYYTKNNPSTSNKNFYVTDEDSGDQRSGYTIFPLSGISNEHDYNSIEKVAVAWRNADEWLTPAPDTSYIKYYDMCVMFKKEVSIKKQIFSPFKGRIFDDTWGGRKDSASMMQTPPELMEHLERLSNWADCSVLPSAGWGKGYAVGAKISTGTTNPDSYDYTGDSNFTYLNSYHCAGQVGKYTLGYNDKMKRILCRDYFLGTYYDKDGNACIQRILKSETTPSDSVTLADIVDRNKIKIIEPKPADLFPEPFIRYRKNNATDEYESTIRVTNASAETYDSSYVEGVTGGEAEELWDKCHAIWKKAGHLEKPPSDLTNKTFMNGSDADTQAKDCIFNWVDWMFNVQIQFPVHYNKAKTWEEMHRFTVNFPQQTSGNTYECMLTGIDVNPYAPHDIIITAIMFREDIPEDYMIKDTYQNFGDDNDWKDTHTVYGDDNDIKDEM